jgi:UDP-2,3-diacylglucosamine hydrolase
MADRLPQQDRAGSSGPICLICGAGTIPGAVADAAIARGRPVLLVAIRGSADPDMVARYPHHWVGLFELDRMAQLARAGGCRELVLIGSVRRPPISSIRTNWRTLRLLPKIVRAFRAGGDNQLLTAVGAMCEEWGFRLVGAHEVAPEVLVPEGALGGYAPDARSRADIVRSLALLQAIGPFDAGQATVVADGHVLAVEAAEGTDKMLERVAAFHGGKSGDARRGVLVKAPKPGQDRRFDLPTIGPVTITGAGRAGLCGVAVVAGATIVAEPREVVRIADANGLFVVGVASEGRAL